MQGGSNFQVGGFAGQQPPQTKSAWLSRPDVMEDFDLQMEREKARLNRFIGVKELNNRNEVEKNEKLRKSIIDKEKKLKKRMDLLEKDQKMKVNDYKETLTNKLM